MKETTDLLPVNSEIHGTSGIQAKIKNKIPMDWEVLKIKDVIKFSGGSQPPFKLFVSEEQEGYIRLIQTRDYRTDKYKTYIPIELVKKTCNEDDIIIGRYGPPIFQIFRGLKGAYNVALIKATPNKKALPDYCYYFLSKPELRSYLEGLSQRSGGQTGIDIDKLNDYTFPLPPQQEQRAIATCLSTIDETITKTNQLIAQKELRKKWLMQQLLSGKKRLKGFENTKWKIQPLGNFIKPIVRGVDKPNDPYLGIGIRSHGKGTFLKPDEQPEKNSMDKFYVVRPDDLIVNITFAWEQAIAIVRTEDDGALASHRFPTFTFIKDKGHSDFFRFYIIQPRMKYMLQLISPGGAGRNRVMSKSDFIKLEFLLPEYKEQTAIAQVLQSADKEIQLLKAKAEKLK